LDVAGTKLRHLGSNKHVRPISYFVLMPFIEVLFFFSILSFNYNFLYILFFILVLILLVSVILNPLFFFWCFRIHHLCFDFWFWSFSLLCDFICLQFSSLILICVYYIFQFSPFTFDFFFFSLGSFFQSSYSF
jgi:hypothetical protein